MATVYDIKADVLIEATAKELAAKPSMKAPEWAAFVKTGPSKERVPARDDWWYIRAAAILRTIYRSKGPIGVQKLRMKYGSKKNRGHKPEKFYRSSGKIIRVILQQLEKEGLLINKEVGVHKGRSVSPRGKSLLDKLASKLAENTPKKSETPKEEKKAEAKEEKKEAKKEEEKAPKEDKKEDTPKESPGKDKTEKKETKEAKEEEKEQSAPSEKKETEKKDTPKESPDKKDEPVEKKAEAKGEKKEAPAKNE